MNSPKNGTTSEKGAPPPQDVAVYLDFENLYVSLKTTVKMEPNFDLLMEKCREFGRVTVARAYADWSEFTRILTSQMFANGFEPVYVPTRKFYDAKTRAEARKNSVDIHITIDIIKSLFQHENVDVFILISGDRDYVPLINNIRQHGKAVYALGVAGCTSGELSAAVDEMFFYHQLLEENGEEKAEQVDVYNQLMRAVRIARRRGYPTTLGILKPIMKELVEGFNERNYKNARGQPFQKFKDLVSEAQRRRMVRLVTSNAVSELFLWGEEPSKLAAPVTREAQAAGSGRGGRDRDRGGRDRGGRDRGERRPAAVASGGAATTLAESDLLPGEIPPPDDSSEAEADATPGMGRESTPAEAVDERHTRPREESPARSRPPAAAALPAPVAEDEPPPPAPKEKSDAELADERLTGLRLDEPTWAVIRRTVVAFGARPPSPRKLVTALKQARDEGQFAEVSPTEADIQDLVRQAVESGKLERQRKGFSTIYRLREAEAAETA